jgi:hypothetical protein
MLIGLKSIFHSVNSVSAWMHQAVIRSGRNADATQRLAFSWYSLRSWRVARRLPMMFRTTRSRQDIRCVAVSVEKPLCSASNLTRKSETNWLLSSLSTEGHQKRSAAPEISDG